MHECFWIPFVFRAEIGAEVLAERDLRKAVETTRRISGTARITGGYITTHNPVTPSTTSHTVTPSLLDTAISTSSGHSPPEMTRTTSSASAGAVANRCRTSHVTRKRPSPAASRIAFAEWNAEKLSRLNTGCSAAGAAAVGTALGGGGGSWNRCVRSSGHRVISVWIRRLAWVQARMDARGSSVKICTATGRGSA